MNNSSLNKKKIINDPVYGLVNIPFEIIFDLIEHPYFQRLRRIQQLGLTHLVYPGALHTRFHHALGAMHLMMEAIDVIKSKGVEVTDEETEAAAIAILLHDIGHGPFSHSLEKCIIKDIDHEDISVLFMKNLNIAFNGRLLLAIEIFQNKYKKKFLHQLVSSQLDVDRLDFLKRDSFYTGVVEGNVGYDRIIKMMNVSDDKLVIDAKGIHSIESFIISRRLMYWQVYYHKAVVSAERLLINILKRAKELAEKGEKLFATSAFSLFLYNKIDISNYSDVKGDEEHIKNILDNFSKLDDSDIFTSIKEWTKSDDKVLSMLCNNLMNRVLYRIEKNDKPFDADYVDGIREKVKEKYGISEGIEYLVNFSMIENNTYKESDDNINILVKDGKLVDMAELSDQFKQSSITKPVRKYYLYYPKGIN